MLFPPALCIVLADSRFATHYSPLDLGIPSFPRPQAKIVRRILPPRARPGGGLDNMPVSDTL